MCFIVLLRIGTLLAITLKTYLLKQTLNKYFIIT